LLKRSLPKRPVRAYWTCAQRNGFKNNARRPLPSDTERLILKCRLVPSVILARLFFAWRAKLPDAGAKTRDPSWQPREGDKQGSATAFLGILARVAACSRRRPALLDVSSSYMAAALDHPQWRIGQCDRAVLLHHLIACAHQAQPRPLSTILAFYHLAFDMDRISDEGRRLDI